MQGYTVELDWDGRRQTWHGVDVQVDEEINITTDKPTYRARQLELVLLFGWDVVRWVHVEGHSPSTASVTVWDGETLLSTSGVSRLAPGRSGEPTLLTLEDRPIEDLSTIPPRQDIEVTNINWTATLRKQERVRAKWTEMWQMYDTRPLQPIEFSGPNVSRKTHLQYDTAVQGRTYQMVFGQPGSNGVPAVRGLYIDTDLYHVMSSGHGMVLGTATMFGPAAGAPTEQASGSVQLRHIRDESERRISIVQADDYTATFASKVNAEGKPFWFAFDGTARGLPGDAAEVVGRLLGLTAGIRTDFDSLANVLPRLVGWYLSGVVEAPTSAWAVLRDVVLPLLPVQLVATPLGIGAVYTGMERSRKEARFTVREGADFAAVGRPEMSGNTGGGAIRNSLTLEYSLRATDRVYTESFIADERAHPVLAWSASRYGRREGQTVRSHWIYRSEVAQRSAIEQALRTAVDRFSCEYEATPEVYGPGGDRDLRVGDLVILEHADEGMSSRLAMVTARRRRPGRLRFRLTTM